MESEDKVGVRELFANVTEDIRFAKRQQWTVGYFVILAHAGLAGFYTLLAAQGDQGDIPKIVIFCVSAFITVAGVWYLAACQAWMRKSRMTLRRIHRSHSSEGFVEARGVRELSVSFWKHGFVLIMLVVLTHVGAGLLMWYVFQDLAFAVKFLFLFLALSLVILLWLSRKT